MIENIKMNEDNVLLKKIEVENKTASGFILPDDVKQDQFSTYEIVSIGDGSYCDGGVFIPTKLKKGAKVKVMTSTAKQTVIDGEDYFVCGERHIVMYGV